MEKNLELTIRLNRNNFDVDVYEPESGEVSKMQFPYNFEASEHPAINAIGSEIFDWITLWGDRDEEEEDDDG